MKVGFTGTQIGVTQPQLEVLRDMLSLPRTGDQFHHGDCIGADADAAWVASSFGYWVVAHPPTDPIKRAFSKYNNEILPEYPYLTRNRHIVDACDQLIATPKQMFEELRSGTWATVRYAEGKIKVVIIYPDGSVGPK